MFTVLCTAGRRFSVAVGVLVLALGASLAFITPAAAATPAASVMAPAAASGCPSGDLCVWVDAGFKGGNGPGTFVQNNGNWTEFPNSFCQKGNWNDCASSIQNADSTRTANVYINANFQSSRRCLPSGTAFTNLTQVDYQDGPSNMNDNISSNSFSRNACP